jgi:cytochrome c biogenesis protein CcdA
MVATVNPCGFPMLPAYLSWFIGLDDDEPGVSRVPRALTAGAAVSLGFFLVFGGLGIPVEAGVSSIYEWMPWMTNVIGVALAAVGGALLTGRSVQPRLPRLDRGGRTRRFGSMVLYGASYAVASLGCTLPLFLAVVAGTAERANAASGALAFLAFAAGTTVVLLALSVTLALARDGMTRGLRKVLPYVSRIAGVLLVLVGIYLVGYGVRAIRDDDTASSPVAWVDSWSTSAATWLEEGSTQLGAVMAVVVAAGVVWSVTRGTRDR